MNLISKRRNQVRDFPQTDTVIEPTEVDPFLRTPNMNEPDIYKKNAKTAGPGLPANLTRACFFGSSHFFRESTPPRNIYKKKEQCTETLGSDFNKRF